MSDGGTYFLGPMARYSLNSTQLSDVAREAAEEAGLGESAATRSSRIIVRAVEILYAFDEALRLIDNYEPPEPPAVEVRAEGRGRLRLERGAARDALAPLPPRGRRLDRRGADRPADLPEPGPDRAGPARVRPAAGRPAR